MTEATPIPTRGVPEADLRRLIARGRARGVLTMDEVVDVLRKVELTQDLLDQLREQLAV